MIVAVIAVLMMQTPVDHVVDVIAVRDRFVSAAGAVDVAGLATGRHRVHAAVRILVADLDDMLVVVHLTVRLVWMVQVPVVQIVDVVAVADRLMTAAGTVRVVVIGMDMAGLRHEQSSTERVAGVM